MEVNAKEVLAEIIKAGKLAAERGDTSAPAPAHWAPMPLAPLDQKKRKPANRRKPCLN